MEPFKLSPVFKDYLWGGSKLKSTYNKTGSQDITAESWELSAWPESSSVIATGPLAGMRFDDFVSQYPALCKPLTPYGTFPILIKLIDAKKSLSIQVHPDDEYAYRTEGNAGKTEMWVILECEPSAFLYYGFIRTVTKDEIFDRIKNNTLTEVLRAVPVHPGDVFFIPAGTIHAIGSGIVLAEIQQSSDSTYRVYDFGRLDVNGNPRELHIQKALDVMRLTPDDSIHSAVLQKTVSESGCTLTQLAQCRYFTVERLSLVGDFTYSMDNSSFVSLLCTDGTCVLTCDGIKLTMHKGDSVFVPTGNTCFNMTGSGTFLVTTV